MRGGSTRDVLKQLRTLYQFGISGHLSDEQLLERFLARRDETAEEAFAAIVHRHGPMVLGVCLRVLGDAHEAEDAFQATFFVLARKAASVIRRERVANWLYGVAYRTAKQARGRAARRRVREQRAGVSTHVEPADRSMTDELRSILDEELARLPARYRGPVVLCELEGLSRQEAARRLEIPEGTLSSRLARAKARLRERLARRGLSVSMIALLLAMVREANAAFVAELLMQSTAVAAMRIAAGSSASVVVSVSVASLTEGVIKAMVLTKMKGIVLGLGTLGAIVSGAVALAQSGSANRRESPAPLEAGLPRPVEAGSGLVKIDDSAEPKSRVPSDPDEPASLSETDRTAAMEKKLDRILDALDRFAKTSPSQANDPSSARNQKPAGDSGFAYARGRNPLRELTATRPTHPSRANASIADRLKAVEDGWDATQQQLARVEARLSRLEKQVGGAVNEAFIIGDHPQNGSK